jgi:uncharacterized membrane protein
MTPVGTFRFENVEHPWLWLLAIALGAWLFFLTYRGIFQRTERRLTWWLMGLRGAGLLALLLALAKPTWTRETQRVDPGRVAVILDDSLSMSLADASGQSRYALAVKAAAELTEAVTRPRTGPRVEVDLFDVNGSPIAEAPPKEPRAERTDLVRAVSQTTSRLRSKALVGVVLITDGVDNTGRGDLLALADTPAPVYTVGFREDPDAAQLDLALQDVQAPKRVIVYNEIKVDMLVSKTAGPAVEATVAIKRGREEVVRQEMSLPEGDARERVSLTFAPAEAGSFVYTASVETPVGERLLANNAGHFPLLVEAEPIRVFYVEGFLRHEYKFLKNRLEDDPDVGLVSVVRRGKPERLQAGAGGQLITAERLESLDIMIFGDMEADYLTESEYLTIVDWLDQGHALLVLGGYQSFGPDGFRATPLADVLPVVFRDGEPFQSEEPFVLKLTEAGMRHPVFEITGDRVKDEAMWNASPHLLGCGLVARAKQGAEVLAVNPAVASDDGPAPVVVIQRYGAGTVMLLAVDTTWRWSRLTRVLNQSDTLFGRFWGQTVRWLSGRDEEAERPLIAVSTDQPDYEVGKPVTIRVSRLPQPDGEGATGDVSVELIDEAGGSVPVETGAGSLDPDTFTGVYYPSAGGRYEVAAALNVDGQAIANQTTEFLVHGSDLELADTRTNRPQLQAIANATGGVYADVEDAASLADRIERRERRTPLVERAEFWNSPILFIVFLAAITAEWVIRRRNHLA